MVAEKDDFFGNDAVATSDLPRFSINDDGEPMSLVKVQGVYEDSVVTEIQGKDRLLHQIKLVEPVADKDGKKHDRIFLWGNYDMDQSLPCLVPGTKVRITFGGKESIGKGKTLKRTPVEYPANATKRRNPFKVKVTGKGNEGADAVPF